MDRLKSMSVLIAVAEAGSLSAAARSLGMPLPTVSRRINELENYLGTRLLTRTTRQLSLTPAGSDYVAMCRRILDELQEAEKAAIGEYREPRGELNMTAPVLFGQRHVVPVISAFLAQFPQIQINLQLADRVIHLFEEHVDVAVRIGKLPDSSMISVTLGEVSSVICASPGYFAKCGIPDHPDQLVAHDCILFTGISSGYVWYFHNDNHVIAVELTPRLTVNSAEGAISAALQGAGLVRVLSYQVADLVKQGLLNVVLEEFQPPPWPVNIVHTGQSPIPVKVRAFFDYAVPALRERLKGI